MQPAGGGKRGVVLTESKWFFEKKSLLKLTYLKKCCTVEKKGKIYMFLRVFLICNLIMIKGTEYDLLKVVMIACQNFQ